MVSVEVVHRDQGTVHDPGHGETSLGVLADGSVMCRAVMVRPRPADHHRRAVQLELRVGDASVIVRETLAPFAEPERP